MSSCTERIPPRPPARARALLGMILLLLVSATALAPPARAAALTEVTGFGDNPGGLAMYAYVPASAEAGAPLVVLLHGCTQNAAAYHAGSGWQKYADSAGIVLVYAEQRTTNNISRCFNWFQPGDVARDRGEARSIRQMVAHAHAAFGADPDRTYVSGLSAGGAMAAEMLSAYPETFAGGAVIAGLPAGCATDLLSALGCQNPGRDRTPAQWGDAVRAKNPGYTGPWPRVAIWHGTADTTVVPANARESRDQWTDVWGIGQTPTTTTRLPGGTTLEEYAAPAGGTAVAGYLVEGMGHGTPVDPGPGAEECGTAAAHFLDTICSSYHTARFWGIVG
ncbi:alpha/beta hydrolase family esterase [Marinactinospora rubrisoli]|uniref:Alpha/beta hydrolase family esterase n=1 Tax=Marinactinospora rubrisoli TaxID=2715399 RepID=A0ABW2KDU6_9ACTN